MCPTTELMVHVSVSNRLPMECSYVREAKIFMFDGIIGGRLCSSSSVHCSFCWLRMVAEHASDPFSEAIDGS